MQAGEIVLGILLFKYHLKGFNKVIIHICLPISFFVLAHNYSKELAFEF